MTFARWTFRVAGVYGLLVTVPQYFLEGRIGRATPPPITHPEFFYGFTGVVIAWQLAFLVIGQDPVRYRPLMLPAVVEKVTFAVATWALFTQGRVAISVVAFATIDLVLATLFTAAYFNTKAIGKALSPPDSR